MKKRITMFGLPGAGKSTLANQLAKDLNLPIYHLDMYFFKEDWKEVGLEQFVPKLKELVSKEKWIIDGNSLATIEHRFARADIIIYFRFPRLLCLWRVFKRRIFSTPFQAKREDCPSMLTWGLIKFLWTYYKLRDPRALNLLNQYKDRQVYIVSNDLEVAALRSKLLA